MWILTAKVRTVISKFPLPTLQVFVTESVYEMRVGRASNDDFDRAGPIYQTALPPYVERK